MPQTRFFVYFMLFLDYLAIFSIFRAEYLAPSLVSVLSLV